MILTHEFTIDVLVLIQGHMQGQRSISGSNLPKSMTSNIISILVNTYVLFLSDSSECMVQMLYFKD